MKKKTSIFFLVLLSALAVMAGARHIIMKIELKDGTVRYVDTESVDEFSFMTVDEIPADNPSTEITLPLWYGTGVWFHTGFNAAGYYSITVDQTYASDDPSYITYTIKGNEMFGNPVNLVLDKEEYSIPCQYTGYDHPEYGPIWIADQATYNSEVLGNSDQEGMRPERTYYNGWKLNCVYYAPKYKGAEGLAEFADDIVVPSTCDYMYPSMSYEEDESGENVVVTYIFHHPTGRKTDLKAAFGWAVLDPESETHFTDQQELIRGCETRIAKGHCDYDGRTEEVSLSFTVPAKENVWFAISYEYRDPDNPNADEKISYTEINSVSELNTKTCRINSPFVGNFQVYVKRLSPKSQEKDVEFKISSDYYNLTVTVPDMNDRDENGFVPVTFPGTDSGMSLEAYGKFYRGDVRWYILNYLKQDESVAQQYEPSLYDPATGAFKLHTLYYCPEYSTSNNVYGYDFETVTDNASYSPFLPCLEVQVRMDTSSPKAIVTASKAQENAPIAYYRIAVGENNESALMADINDHPEKHPAIKATAGAISRTYDYEIAPAVGILVVAYTEDGSILEKSFQIQVCPYELRGYEFYSSALMTDGWIIWQVAHDGDSNPIEPAYAPFETSVYRNLADPTHFLVASPWTKIKIASWNETPELAKMSDLEIIVEDGMVAILPQTSGYTLQGTEYFVANLEGLLMHQNPSLTLKECVELLHESGKDELISYAEPGSITISCPVYGNSIEDCVHHQEEPYGAYISFYDEPLPAKQMKPAANSRTIRPLHATNPDLLGQPIDRTRHPLKLPEPAPLKPTTLQPVNL